MFWKKGIMVTLWFKEDRVRTEHLRFMAMPRVDEFVLLGPEGLTYRVKTVNWAYDFINEKLKSIVLLEGFKTKQSK